jgi:hypothetical protein
MRRASLLVAAAVLASGVPFLAAGHASASSSPGLECEVAPGHGTFTPRSCGTTIPSSLYTLDYLVTGGSGTYTYSWTRPAGTTVLAGCTSASSDCEVSIPDNGSDIMATATVVLTQGSTQTTVLATAHIAAVCGKYFC